LDEFATSLIWAYLSREDNYSALQSATATAELATVRGRMAEIDHELQELERELKQRKISARLAGVAEQEWLTELDQLRQTEQTMLLPAVLHEFIQPGEDVQARWENPDTTIAAKRQIARMLFAPDVLGTLVVGPAAYLRQPVHDRVRFRRLEIAGVVE
jgi:hypothetical protein